MPTTSDPAELRAAAEAQLERLQGPLWASEEQVGGWPPPAGTSAPTRRRNARKGSKATSTAGPRRPGRPAHETPRLPRREVRIPVVVDERAREVAAWGGIEPIEALWLLASLGWETWRSGRALSTGRASS
jgi:hypothetical protein